MSPSAPTPPSEIDAAPSEVRDRLAGRRVPVDGTLAAALAATGAELDRDDVARADAGRDWWPISLGWAAAGLAAARPEVVVRPKTPRQVAEVLAHCSAAGVPVTPMAGRSGVCGGAVPVYGGVALDLTCLHGDVEVDETSLVAEAPASIFGPDLEASLRRCGTGYTLGHWPQSMALSTLGGWLACRGAGQYSTRYGKIEDMVLGLQAVLADGRIVHTEGKGPRAATGPNLTQLFVGSEGTLGVITAARLRIHPVPPGELRAAFGFPSFDDGLDACRRILRRGATPAVLRLYDEAESRRNFDRAGTCVLVVLDEADPALLAATRAVVEEECTATPTADRLDDELVEHWLSHRNDVSALVPLWQGGVVVDTVEIAARWSALPGMTHAVLQGLRDLPGTVAASVHQSHAYTDGACLYFTFAGTDPAGSDRRGTDPAGRLAWEESYYRQAWDRVTAVVVERQGAISHHHGIGLNRARFLPRALGGAAFEVLCSLKRALDPAGVLNPGKLGLPSPFGPLPFASPPDGER